MPEPFQVRRCADVSRAREIHAFTQGIFGALDIDPPSGVLKETEADFAETLSLVGEAGFDNAYIFRYSPRRDTPAATLPDQVSEEVKEERNQDLLSVVNDSARRSGERLVGQKVEILCEGPSKTNARPDGVAISIERTSNTSITRGSMPRVANRSAPTCEA